MKKTHRVSESLIVAIDIGTTKICVLVAYKTPDNNLDIVGIGKAPSDGLARGVVVDVARAVRSIKAALAEAQLMSGIAIESAYIGISGSHIQSCNSQGVVALRNGPIRETDIAHVIAAAKAVPLPEGQHILHVLPQFFIIDGQHKVRDPLGMHGIRLEAQVHIITGALASVQNLVRCCELAGVKVRDIILEPLASADAVLSPDEKELGAFMLDIGGGTADFAFYQQGTVRHTYVIPIAGDLFTQDIALCLRTTLDDAERIKHEFGCASTRFVPSREMIEVEMAQGGQMGEVSQEVLAAILESRAQELLMLVAQEIDSNYLDAPAGLVLTGGGSLLRGLDILAQEMLGIPARVGRPFVSQDFSTALESPMYATSYGLLVHAANKTESEMLTHLDGPFVIRVFSRMKSWVFDFF